MKTLILILTTLASSAVVAYDFQAPVTDTRWQVIESPLECTLTQTIPGYGTAGFKRKTGESLQLFFTTYNQPSTQNNVYFQISPAPWQNSDEADPLISLPTLAGQSLFMIESASAQRAFTQLQEGRFPFIEYRSQTYQRDIKVALSTIKLNDVLPGFQQCLAQLHPDAFDDINQLTIYFGLEDAALDKKDKLAVDRLANYAKLDDTITQIHVVGHTDNHGRKRLNKPLSLARALAVKTYLVKEHGFTSDMITLESKVDHAPAVSNKTSKGRAFNRRAEVTLIR
jgi:outer membrane protein OmpA-like peptidoglycan-associated protein